MTRRENKQTSKRKNRRSSNRHVRQKPALAAHLSLRLREGIFIVVSALSLFLLLALLTFHQSDPSWTHTGAVMHVANAGGRVGAWIADVLLLLFGYPGYLLPLMFVYSAWLYFRAEPGAREFDVWAFILRATGFVFIFAAGSGIVSLQFSEFRQHVPFSAGGILGNNIGFGLSNALNVPGTTLILLAIFCSGITLFTGLSWLGLIDRTGALCLNLWDGVKYQAQRLYHAIQQQCSVHRNAKKQRRALQRAMAKTASGITISRSGTEPVTTSVRVQGVSRPKGLKQHFHIDEDNGVVKNSSVRIETASDPIALSERSRRDRQLPLFNNPVTGTLPSLSLLDVPDMKKKKGYSNQQLEAMSREVEGRLQDFGIKVQVVAVHPGPVITRFEMQLAAGVKVSRISSLAKDLARSLSTTSVRIVEVIPGKTVVGLELPNEDREMVSLSEILSSQTYEKVKSPLALALGKDISGCPVVVDLGKMPHLLVAGTTGSGKSVGVNAMLMGLLYKSTPAEVRMILVDPKMLELSVYEGIPHLLTPVVTDMKEAANGLRWCVAEMERRYRLMAALGVRNLTGFNNKVKNAAASDAPIKDPLWRGESLDERPALNALPFIVVVIDEYADMMMVVGKKVEQLIARIAQKARAAGIHLILATQRPSVDVITGLIKANIPTRIAFQVSSKIDSRTIIDQGGAEQLLGHGDLLYLPPGTSIPIRVHGAFVSDEEVHRVVADWKRRGEPEYIEAITVGSDGEGEGNNDGGGMGDDSEKDVLYDEAVFIVTKTRRASISSIQRRLKIGYNRAARLVEEMEAAGVVSQMESNGSREVLAPPPPERVDA